MLTSLSRSATSAEPAKAGIAEPSQAALMNYSSLVQVITLFVFPDFNSQNQASHDLPNRDAGAPVRFGAVVVHWYCA